MRPDSPEPSGTPAGGTTPGRAASFYARRIVALRWFVIFAWLLIVVLALNVKTDQSTDSSGGLKGLLSGDTPSVATELRSVDLFGFPLIGRTVLVQRDADGLSVYAQARSANNALALDRKKFEVEPILGALPLTNAFGLFPGAQERDTASITYLFFDPSVSLSSQTRAAHRYADRFFEPNDHVVGVTGSVPARRTQGDLIEDHLPTVELVTLLAIALIVGAAFRSLIAPVVALGVTGVAYVVTIQLTAVLADLLGVSIPTELRPILVAMLLGVATDYVVFFCSGLRNALAVHPTKHAATIAASASFVPIVTVAGLAVAFGTVSLAVARSAFFRPLGPALALTVLIGVVVSVTLVPALMAVLGRFMFWPVRNVAAQADDTPNRAGRPKASVRWAPSSRFAHRRGLAALVVAGCLAGLALAATPVLNLGLGVSFVEALPPDTEVRQSATAAQSAFAPGILSPSVVLVEGDGIGRDQGALQALGDRLEQQPGVAGVVGPGDLPGKRAGELVVTPDKDAARYLVVFDKPPLGADAIDDVDALQTRLPGLIRDSGIDATSSGIGGDSATAAFIVDQTQQDLVRIAIAVLLANFLVLLLFLRAAVAAAYLLFASLLSVSAALGLTTLVFDIAEPGQGLTFYVPFAAAVLLLAFGSDYNIFGVGHVWEEARTRSLAESITRAMPGTIRALAAAGLALAASFGLLAVVPLAPFRELAFAMSVGILLDIFVVRLLLMPALLVLVGPASAWPSKRLRSGDADADTGADVTPRRPRPAGTP